jgi:hypothetical protein
MNPLPKNRWQFSLLALLLAITLASICLAIGIRLSRRMLLCTLFAPILVTVLISAASVAHKRKHLTWTLSVFALCIVLFSGMVALGWNALVSLSPSANGALVMCAITGLVGILNTVVLFLVMALIAAFQRSRR